jgi:hypothetical protein
MSGNSLRSRYGMSGNSLRSRYSMSGNSLRSRYSIRGTSGNSLRSRYGTPWWSNGNTFVLKNFESSGIFGKKRIKYII